MFFETKTCISFNSFKLAHVQRDVEEFKLKGTLKQSDKEYSSKKIATGTKKNVQKYASEIMEEAEELDTKY